MNVPVEYYRYLIQSEKAPFQINSDYDASGDEVYSGVAPVRALVGDPLWAIGKAVYTPTQINGATINLLTHWSFVSGVAWTGRTSLVFP